VRVESVNGVGMGMVVQGKEWKGKEEKRLNKREEAG